MLSKLFIRSAKTEYIVTPEHTYEEPDTSISHFNQKLSTLKMSDESHKDSIMVEENVAYRSFNSIPAATIKVYRQLPPPC